jgi:ribonuclease R
MIDKVGKSYSGLICDVTSFGIFVELTDTYVHGLIHISTLPGDYYAYDAAGHCLRGRRSGRIFRLGDSLDVIISRVDIDKRQIDFDLQ